MREIAGSGVMWLLIAGSDVRLHAGCPRAVLSRFIHNSAV